MKKINFLIILNLFANCLCSQKRQIVTIFDALNCSNYAIYDENVDSICKNNDVEHLYYVKNLWRGEVEAYSKKLFGKQIKTFQLVDENLSRKINFEQIPAYYVCLIIDGHLLKTIRIDQVDERLLLKFNNYKNDVLLLNPSKTYFKDSLTLNQKRTYKLPSKIRLTDVSPILKDKNSLYIVDPLFREEIYKVNLNDSNYYLSKQLNHLVNIDSIHFYCYIDLKQENKILFDSIMYYAKIESSSEFRVFKMYMDKSNLFLLGSVKILTYIDGLFQMLNHNMVLKLDSNLNIINYYFDKKLNYNQYYPLLIGNSCPVCDESFVYTQTIREFDEVIKIKKNLIYRINETKHLLIPFRKDTLNLPFDLYNTFYSNVSGTFYNIGNAEAVWFLDPFLYLYYPSDTLYFDLIEDTLIKKISLKSKTNLNTGPFFNYILKINNSLIHIDGNYLNFSYSFDIDIEAKKILRKQEYPLLTKFNLKVLSDLQGKRYFIPINSNSTSNNLVYFD